jgi:hypothetical protein
LTVPCLRIGNDITQTPCQLRIRCRQPVILCCVRSPQRGPV